MRRRLSALLLLFVVLTGILAAFASVVPPLQISCAPTLSDQACHDTVTAALERGLAPFHPLILAANVEPGPAADPAQNGHRATVTFDLLGVPGFTSVRLFYDIGGHWGGVPDRSFVELAAWSLLAATVVAGLGAGTIILFGRNRPGVFTANGREP